MTIYVEYALIDNLIINSLLLIITFKIVNINVKKWKIFLSALFGSVCSIIIPILSFWLSYVFKFLLCLLMPLFCLHKPKTKKILLCSITFLVSTFIFLGFCIIFCQTFGISYTSIENGELAYNFPMGLAVLLCYLIFLIVKQLIKIFYLKRRVNNFIFSVNIINNNVCYNTNAFLDTGNFITDNSTNKPVCLINLNVLKQLFPKLNLTDILLKKIENTPLKNARFIPISSITNTNELLIFEVDNVIVFNEKTNKNFNNVLLGISFNNFSNSLQAECILNYKLFEQGV